MAIYFQVDGYMSYSTTCLQQHFSLFGELAKGKKGKRFRNIIWLATI
jgi:hypothetical protein